MNAEELAGQLRKPHGENAAEVGKSMYESNINMISNCISELDLSNNSKVLELGFGNGSHLKDLFQQFTELEYWGLELSPEMIAEAKKLNLQANFILTNENSILDFPNDNFDAFFSVNTIYFWSDIRLQLTEINRTLKPNGQMSLSFVKKEFAENLPFTKFNFNLYSKNELRILLEAVGFSEIKFKPFTEKIVSKNGQMVDREYFVLTASKNV